MRGNRMKIGDSFLAGLMYGWLIEVDLKDDFWSLIV